MKYQVRGRTGREKRVPFLPMQSDINCGTGVPPVITAGMAVPRRDAQLFKLFCIDAQYSGPARAGEFAWGLAVVKLAVLLLE